MTESIEILVPLVVLLLFLFIVISLFFEWVERKLLARIQRRIGPYFTGPAGILQPFIDFAKLLMKREIIPEGVDITFYRFAPILATTILTLGFLFIPILGPEALLSFRNDLLVILVVFVLTSLSYMLAGLSVRTPFTLSGTSRLVVQYSLYELIFLLTFVLLFIQVGSASIRDILSYQISNNLLVMYQPVGFIVALFSLLAKLERPPFDLPHAKQEIAAGWMTELSGRTLAFMRLANDMDLALSIMLITTLFLGGGWGPGVSETPLLWPLYFLIKSLTVLLIITLIEGIAVRAKSILLPMRLGLPLTLLLIVQALVIYALEVRSWG